MPLSVCGAWKGFQRYSDLVQDFTQLKTAGSQHLEKSDVETHASSYCVVGDPL